MPYTIVAMMLLASVALAQGDSASFRYVLFLGREYVNDHALIEDRGTWHLFYTRGDMSIRPWMSPGNEIDIGHAVSNDLLEWRTVAPALRIGARGSLDAEHVYAPAVIRDGDGWRMLYTGNARGFFSGEQILAASSSDLQTWTKLDEPPAPMPDTSWAAYYPPGYDSGFGGPISCRDPFVLELPDGSYVCYFVARLRDTAGLPARACVAAATSTDLRTWTPRGPVLTRAVTGDDVNPYTHPESPCVVMRNGRYYLFWKGGSGTRYVMSDDPLDFEGREERLLATSHASKVFEWRGDWFITSCSRNVNDVMHTQSDRTRGLYIAGLAWDGDRPRVTELPASVGIRDEDGQSDERAPNGRTDNARVVDDRSLGVRPNPARAGEPVLLTASASRRDDAVVLIDVLGRTHRAASTRAGGALMLETDGLAPGFYVVRIGERGARLVITE
ncbi:MAG TPA: hypothetical protein VNA88_18115 [Candidatus Kapabacteria bacterium]|nr:hypothetical protein [Candidatus Kapabacteria bacterium]